MPAIIFLGATRLSRRRALLLATLLVAQGAVNPYYAGATLATLAVVACARLASATTRGSGTRLLAVTMLAALALVAVYAPWAWLRLHEPELERQSTWLAERLRARVVAMRVPFDLFADRDKPTAVPLAFVLIIAVGAAARLLPRAGRIADGERTAWRHGFAWAATGVVLSLHSTVTVLGRTVHLPWAPVLELPLVGLLRDPSRIGVGALFGVALLSAVAFAECTRRLARVVPVVHPAAVRVATALFIVAVGARQWFRFDTWPWSAPYPLVATAITDSPVMDALRKPGGPLLELPVDPAFTHLTERRRANAFAVQARAMFDSIGHWRRLLNGYGGFYPAGFIERMRLAARLPDREALAELRATTGLELVRVRGSPRARTPMDRWNELARRGGGEGLRFVARDGNDLLFAVADDASTTFDPDD
jgi:hypothetical protein